MAPGQPVTPSLLSGLAGFRQCRAGIAFGLGCVLGLRCFECGEDDGGGLLDGFQTLGEESGVAAIELDIRSAGISGVESDSGSNHKRNCFGLGLAHCLGGGDAPLGTMQKGMREFVNQSAELFGLIGLVIPEPDEMLVFDRN